MAVKNEIIEKQIDLLGKQRESILYSFREIDYDKMSWSSKKMELDFQLNKIDIRIDTLIEKLT